jgi:hypothetical protein
MNRSVIKRLAMFLCLFAIIGFAREFFFVNINNIMIMRYYNTASIMKVPGVMKFFLTWDYDTLYYSKYLFTLLWVVVFYFASYLMLKTLTPAPVFRKLLFYAYCAMLVIAGVSMAYGYVVNNRLQDSEYTISRWVLGVAQSPIISLILLASEKLYNRQKL